MAKIDAGLRRIVQIIPASGWSAHLRNEDMEVPVVCWALIEEVGLRRRIVGVIETRDKEPGRLEFVDAVDDFGGYQYRPPSIGD